MSVILKDTVSAWEWAQTIKASNADEKNYPNWVKHNFTAADLNAGYMQSGFFYRPLYQVKHKAGLIDQVINTNSNHNITAQAGTPAHSLELVLVGYVTVEKMAIFDGYDDEKSTSEVSRALRQTLTGKSTNAGII